MKSTHFKKEFPEWEYLQFTVDPSVDAIKDKRNGGIIQLRCYIRHVEDGNKPIAESMPDKRLPSRPVAMKVRAFIYQCKDLLPADSNGLADPFIRIWTKNKTAPRTKVVKETLSPIFYEVRDLDVDIFVDSSKKDDPKELINHCHPLIFDIWDEDKGTFGNTNEYVTRATFNLKDASCVFIG